MTAKNTGEEYEKFVFDAFTRLFAGADVRINDRIRGHQSGLEREIDVSVRIPAEDVSLLYVAQCKDWKSPADIKVLGEFSAVIKDVQASKGFLLCTSGFAKSNHQYALTLGIELVTIEDIRSEKWKADVQIPFLYIQKFNNFRLNLEFTVNEALAEKNRDRELFITITTGTPLTSDGGATTIRFADYLDRSIAQLKPPISLDEKRDVRNKNLHITIADVWVPCTEFSFTVLSVEKKYYLKYLTPDEYSHLRDHVRGTTLPLHLVLNEVGIRLDETFVELPGDTPPVFGRLSLEVEESSIVDVAQTVF